MSPCLSSAFKSIICLFYDIFVVCKLALDHSLTIFLFRKQFLRKSETRDDGTYIVIIKVTMIGMAFNLSDYFFSSNRCRVSLQELFDFIASGLAKFVSKEDGRFHISPGRKREIGFTFSFPVKQTSIDSGILIKWTKGFAVSGTAESNLSERKTVLEVCETVVRRGGRLAGAGIVGILQKMEEDENRSVVAIDGGLYENYPQYRTYLQDSVEELLGTEKSNNVVIEHTKDGSAIGAALLAASNSIYQQHL
ncbi:hexokinase-2, chloroplastic isoform X1 [Vigna radiata var. radiata]|uniref:Phosphotransferase n=1 Tax=Vigna radiata var. radiata TaxID=3916 RepID=A0A3Q0F4B4_VIGRR|nr:hexokinase-2, chloroplastic isoform X1 [Vigna radiata var. radiata]